MHPFERRGLGHAPFRFVRLVREPGDCAYCGRDLAWCCHVADAGGREFMLGVDCVWQAREDGRLLAAVQAELRHRLKLERADKREARRAACLAALQGDPGFLADKPHPDAWQAGKTLRDEAFRLFRGSGADRLKAFRIIEAALAERAVNAGTDVRHPGRPLVRPGPEAKGRKLGTAPRPDAPASAAARRGGQGCEAPRSGAERRP